MCSDKKYLDEHDRAVTNALCKDYQNVWLIEVDDMSMNIYSESESAIEGAVEVVEKIKYYEEARLWYINNCVAEDDRARMFEETSTQQVLDHISDGSVYVVEYMRNSHGKLNYNQLYYAKTDADDEKITHIVLGFRSIDSRMQVEIDELTGVYVRQAFIRRAEKMLRDNPDIDYDILLADIVDFKQINEKYGNKMGDKILMSVGDFLVSKKADNNLIGRYGGDLFVVLTDHDNMTHICNKLDQYIDQLETEALPFFEMKFGRYTHIDHDRSITTVCDHAHLALNSIKDKYDKICAVYDDGFRKKLEIQRKIEGSMREALKDEQFKVYYQPKHAASTGKLVGAEALIRWIHPEFGFMSPGEFIPIFERNGFVTETDDYVWERTCKNIRRWMDSGLGVVPISVNCSKLAFGQDNLVERFNEPVKSYEIPANLLHIEITESLMEEDVNVLTEVLSELRDDGFEIELDDFGAGYSSINILSTLPLDVVKLDMSFMKQFGDIKRTKVLEACVNLGRNLGYQTISEGVETEEQLEMLKKLGVDTIQGFYYSKPIPESEFEEYLKKYA